MSKKNQKAGAFPVSYANYIVPGLTKREYVAAQLLGHLIIGDFADIQSQEDVVDLSLEYADILLSKTAND